MIWFISGRIENTSWDYPTFRNDNAPTSEKILTQAHCRFLGIDIPSRMLTPEKTFLHQLSEDFKLSHGVYIFYIWILIIAIKIENIIVESKLFEIFFISNVNRFIISWNSNSQLANLILMINRFQLSELSNLLQTLPISVGKNV